MLQLRVPTFYHNLQRTDWLNQCIVVIKKTKSSKSLKRPKYRSRARKDRYKIIGRIRYHGGVSIPPLNGHTHRVLFVVIRNTEKLVDNLVTNNGLTIRMKKSVSIRPTGKLYLVTRALYQP